jgi:tRNA (Thr-GGU) A37 N-methylase
MYKPIGIFSSVYKLKYGTPRQGDINRHSKAFLRLREDIPSSALDGLHEYGHLWVLFVFNHNHNKSTRPKIHPPRLKGEKVGLFASRT